MTVAIESHRKKLAGIEKRWPAAAIIDVISKGAEPWVRFSPFYPHGGILIPNTPSYRFTRLAFEEIGCPEAVKAFSQALAAFPDGRLPANQTKRLREYVKGGPVVPVGGRSGVLRGPRLDHQGACQLGPLPPAGAHAPGVEVAAAPRAAADRPAATLSGRSQLTLGGPVR